MIVILTSPVFWTILLFAAFVAHFYLFAYMGFIASHLPYSPPEEERIVYWKNFGSHYGNGWFALVVLAFFFGIIGGLVWGFYKCGEAMSKLFMR